MKTKLSPFVYKVSGKRNVLLFDSLQGDIFTISPEGCPHELESQLLENGLVTETRGVIPFKFKPNVDMYRLNMTLRELRLRIGGICHGHCPDCGETGRCKKEDAFMSQSVLDNTAAQLANVKIECISVLGGNPLLQPDTLNYIKTRFQATEFRIMMLPGQLKGMEKEKASVEEMGFTVVNSICCIDHANPLSEEDMTLNLMEFFYNKEYNPCWGNRIAVDVNGDIKPCPWSGKILGNITRTSLKRLVFSGGFDEFWQLPKEKFQVCKECEYRNTCPDCRVTAEKQTGSLHGKTHNCSYSPDTGQW